MEKQITIIIPTYNMENYIGKCLDSLLIPELEAVEILVVNDGSKDKSSEIAHQFADRYPQSIKVIDKTNGNYGACINAALPTASGRYVKVLDADDSFDKAAFSEFVKMLSLIDEDLIITNFIRIDENGNCLEKTDFSKISLSDNRTALMKDVTPTFFNHYVPMHRIAYKTQLFTTFDYHQTEGVSYTDRQWAIIPLSFCKIVRFVDVCLYRYLYGRVGQSVDPSTLLKSVPQLRKVIGDTTEFYEKHKHEIVNRQLLRIQVLEFHNDMYRSVMSFGPEYTQEIGIYDKSLNSISPEIYEAVGRITYDPLVRYRIFNKLRESNYKVGFKVPKRVLFELSIKHHINKVFSHNS